MGILTRAVDLDTLNNILDLEAEDVGNQGRALLIMYLQNKLARAKRERIDMLLNLSKLKKKVEELGGKVAKMSLASSPAEVKFQKENHERGENYCSNLNGFVYIL